MSAALSLSTDKSNALDKIKHHPIVFAYNWTVFDPLSSEEEAEDIVFLSAYPSISGARGDFYAMCRKKGLRLQIMEYEGFQQIGALAVEVP